MACILLPAMRADGDWMSAEEREAFCIVERGTRRLALPATAVHRVLSGGTLTPLPGAAAHLAGLVNDRGTPLPVVCVDSWLDVPAAPCADGMAVVVLEGGGLRFGLVVDRVGAMGWLPVAGANAADLAGGPIFAAPRCDDSGAVAVLDPDALAGAAVAAIDAAFTSGAGGGC